jgi:hypothetical protein
MHFEPSGPLKKFAHFSVNIFNTFLYFIPENVHKTCKMAEKYSYSRTQAIEDPSLFSESLLLGVCATQRRSLLMKDMTLSFCLWGQKTCNLYILFNYTSLLISHIALDLSLFLDMSLQQNMKWTTRKSTFLVYFRLTSSQAVIFEDLIVLDLT